jgi:hypothetical protein
VRRFCPVSLATCSRYLHFAYMKHALGSGDRLG